MINKIDFNNIVYINADRDVERKSIIEKQIIDNNVNANRFSAIVGDFDKVCRDWKNLLKIYNPGKTTYSGHGLSFSEIGCLLSHLEVIRIYGNEDLIVFEDDVDMSVSKFWKFSLSEFLRSVPTSVQILQMVKHPSYTPINVLPLNPSSKKHWGTAAYYIKKELCKKIVDLYYIDGLWNIENIESAYYRKTADSVLYSMGGAFTCTLFSLIDISSSINGSNVSNRHGQKIYRTLSKEILTIEQYFS